MKVFIYPKELHFLARKAQNISGDKYKIQNAKENTKQNPQNTTLPENYKQKGQKRTSAVFQLGRTVGTSYATEITEWFSAPLNDQLQSAGSCSDSQWLNLYIPTLSTRKFVIASRPGNANCLDSKGLSQL
jgi:hypothetical protein